MTESSGQEHKLAVLLRSLNLCCTGAQTSQNYVKGYVTHVVASEREMAGPLWRAKVAQGLNIVGLSWLLECAGKRAGVPLRPRHYLARWPGSFDDDPDVDRWGDECGPM